MIIERTYSAGTLRIATPEGSGEPSVRSVAMAQLLAEEVAQGSDLSGFQFKGDPAKALVSEPRAEAAICATADAE